LGRGKPTTVPRHGYDDLTRIAGLLAVSLHRGNLYSLGFKPDVVVDSIPQSLFAAEVSFGRLDADVPEQELNLLEFAARQMAETSACAAKVVWCNVRQTARGRRLFHHAPNDFGTETVGR
jgi:hypothetical protein